MSTTGFEATAFGIASEGRVDITGEVDPYLAEPTVTLTLEAGGEAVAVRFDRYHLHELRLALLRAERWVEAS